MKQDERKFENECRRIARSMGWVCAKLEKNGNTGIPDDLFISPDGICYLVEFKKSETERLRTEQRVWFDRFPLLCLRVDTWDSFYKMIADAGNRRVWIIGKALNKNNKVQ